VLNAQKAGASPADYLSYPSITPTVKAAALGAIA
jgi:hypothetical protein